MRAIARRDVASASSAAPPARFAPTLFEELNTAAFDDQLPGDIELIWNPRLRRTAGRCRFLAKGEEKRAEIELSPRVLDSDVLTPCDVGARNVPRGAMDY